MDSLGIECEVASYLEALAALFFMQQDRHPVRAAITYRHSLRALNETDALRVALGGQSALRGAPLESPRSRA